MNEAIDFAKNLKSPPVVDTDTLADILFTLAYDSASGRHTERYFARGVNFWRDFLPEEVCVSLKGRQAGETIRLRLPAGLPYPPHDPRQELALPLSRFRKRMPNGTRISPQKGRFYPKGLLEGLSGIFPQNTEPFRCTEVDSSQLTADMNHPLSSLQMRLSAEIKDVRSKGVERGGTSTDWFGNLTSGPGMQVRSGSADTDFFSQRPFGREDESPDERFYRQPRFVNHLDDRAIKLIGALYQSLLRPNARVLDLMSSWVSHVPAALKLSELTGLGLNPSELAANDRLDRTVVHDLNRDPTLPFDSAYFDAVICTVSVEYMTRPFDVFEEVVRVLKPQGPFVVTFSNRWFPPKVVRIWKELHDFERMGLVLAYFEKSGAFGSVETLSIRGYPRPIYDRYYPELQMADPVYAVWGRKAAEH